MSGPRLIPQDARAKQTRASNPAASVFVSANAGSGKTHVLVQRVIRLLLADVAPEKILCITFTKAAAANMAERVFETLGHWITLDDTALDAAIRDAGATTGPAMRRRARELFACALETPGGLKVQTIHALCTRLLQQFPFEANVPARFSVLDDRDQNDLMERASLKVLLDAAAKSDSLAGQALATAMTSAADVTFRDVVREAVLSRDYFQAWTHQARTLDTALAQLNQALGVVPGDSLEQIEGEIVDGPHLPRIDWAAISAQFANGSKSDGDQAERLQLALSLSGTAQVEAYLGIFFTGAGELRKSLLTKSLAKDNPGLAAALEREASRVLALLQRRRAVAIRDRTRALLVIATAAADNYRREKEERGLLDYDDLIDKTLAMLERTASSWVHFKLDQGVDHVLIDEAQDTSPRQWDIVEHIVSEFTSGAGARGGIKRTIFAVGDEKQSIFSFQGAAPREFDLRRGRFKSRFEAAELTFDPVVFNYSFRSGAGVLQAVQSTFKTPEIYRSVTSDTDGMAPHMALEDAAPAMIELWELQEADERQDLEGWQAPFDAVSETSPEVKLAQRIRDRIKALITERTATGIASKRRLLRYGDILILVRRRGKTFSAVIQALKQSGIPVAGADRLKLTEHIAIIDLMNLADALLFRRDDLALAVALKSPLFGLGDDELFRLAHDRKGSLRDALTRHADGDLVFKATLQRLESYEARALSGTPFAFYAWLLGGDDGRARMLARLGAEANDALDEFLELALSYERRGPASLQGFMAWLRSADTDIKRDMEISRDEVRVMTVHGAKGLEAPVVILADTTSSPTDTQRLSLIRLPHAHGAGGTCVVWAGRKADDPASVAAARAAMTGDTEDEYRRLLYVAMTRAADRLIVGGCMPGNRNEVREHSWYDLIRKGLETSDLAEETIETRHGPVRHYTRSADPLLPAPISAAAEPESTAPLPPWLRTSAPRDRIDTVLLRPSETDDGTGHETKPGEAAAQRARALKRGVLVHRLLQSLPDIAAERRREVALRHLARNVADWDETERTALADQVAALIAAEKFAAVFAAGSRAEVPIVGRLTRFGLPPVLVSGQIDRLVVTPTEILIIDYKTNHNPPKTAAEAPAAYLRQLALYRALLGRLYPQAIVRAALLWTEAAEIMEIPAPVLDAELARIISS
ncbi:double-strand break repair helicase AddA [Bradyrhizobium prioriisuperbiae]|uniref:double-strand break repair helicase AddA n=1 Tax=Bradyrhizobium prioriisuperbiae TaxID=2854389 RepID=UPI0028E69FB6|nr:double-strand break repair helicase AddA [Bradyrhizobium prioritasuperba]